MVNKRRVPRFSCRLRVLYTDHHENEKIAFAADVSSMGVFVPTPNPEFVGRTIEVIARLPSGNVQLETAVAWSNRPEAGGKDPRGDGFGLRVMQAPEAWYRYCKTLEREQASVDPLVA